MTEREIAEVRSYYKNQGISMNKTDKELETHLTDLRDYYKSRGLLMTDKEIVSRDARWYE